MTQIRLSIFASGGGSNAQIFFERFKDHPSIEIVSVFTNNKSAGVIDKANRFDIPVHVYNRTYWQGGEKIIELLEHDQVDYIVLAGFMLLITEALVQTYSDRIFNIHPALLPKYGGKGMYGSRVHEAVVNNHEPESGISIHYVNKEYDKGNIIFQAKCSISKADTPEDVAQKVHQLEYKHYPAVIRDVLEKL